MSENYFDPSWRELVSLPVRWTGEKWQYFYGGSLPIEVGTLAELRLSAERITDLGFRQRVTQTLKVRVLAEGVPLLVALSDRSCSSAPMNFPSPRPADTPPGTTRFERITLGPSKPKLPRPTTQATEQEAEPGGLFLKLKGGERRELTASSVMMPEGMAPDMAQSLNHAFTLLSQTYEKHRISNTGNVYTRVFYQEGDGRWYPLNDLRTATQTTAGRTVLQTLKSTIVRAMTDQ